MVGSGFRVRVRNNEGSAMGSGVVADRGLPGTLVLILYHSTERLSSLGILVSNSAFDRMPENARVVGGHLLAHVGR